MKDNPVSNTNDYRGSIIQDLPNLTQLDLISVFKEEKRDAGYVVSSDSDDDDDCNENDDYDRHTEDSKQISQLDVNGSKSNKSS